MKLERAAGVFVKMKAHKKGWRYGEVVPVLEAHGFDLHNSKGSHRVFKHESGVRVEIIERGKGEMLPFYISGIISAIEEVKKTGGTE